MAHRCDALSGAAGFSRCGRYRYWLTRSWADGPVVTWIMLNPSQADAVCNDPTIRRCIGFSCAWGYGALHVVNLFAYRASTPAELLAAADPIGRANDRHIAQAIGVAGLVVVAWGCHGSHRDRDRAVLRLLKTNRRRGVCLGRTACGAPRHPLYVPAGRRVEAFAST